MLSFFFSELGSLATEKRIARLQLNLFGDGKMKFVNLLLIFLISLIVTIPNFNCAGNNKVQKATKVKFYTKDNAPPIDLYRIGAAYQVNKNWFMPKNSNCADTKVTSIAFTILPNGEIKDIVYLERSKCNELDDSAYSAIMRAAPFKPFPNSLNVKEIKVALRFKKNGVQ